MKRSRYLLTFALALVALSCRAEIWTEPDTGIEFVKIDAACFNMGSVEPVGADPGGVLKHHPAYQIPLSADEVPAHEVCLDSYWIGRHEIRVQDWNRVMADIRLLRHAGPDHPAADISWSDATEFALRLSQQSGERFRLPTEAEWEHACRGGFEQPVIANSTQLVGTAWYNRGDARRTEPQAVAQLDPNPFGLYDMLGNVWEWVADSYRADAYEHHRRDNPVVEQNAERKVMRGGSFRTEPRQTRCTVRGKLDPEQRLTSVGFRLVRENR